MRVNSTIQVSGEHQVIIKFIVLVQMSINSAVYMILPFIIIISTTIIIVTFSVESVVLLLVSFFNPYKHK